MVSLHNNKALIETNIKVEHIKEEMLVSYFVDLVKVDIFLIMIGKNINKTNKGRYGILNVIVKDKGLSNY